MAAAGFWGNGFEYQPYLAFSAGASTLVSPPVAHSLSAAGHSHTTYALLGAGVGVVATAFAAVVAFVVWSRKQRATQADAKYFNLPSAAER